jgi:crotonobetainyl-CoA:carnitine CoA-transferase CaiB-like acyl-CoA transferase
MPRPLEGIRVLDFGQYIAGPLAAMLLADQGADVTHIDPPGGPRWSTPANATLNRDKRCIQLDLRDTPDLDSARTLVESADVLIENFRPSVMDRLGLGHAAAMAANPRLVYCSLPGFASDDPRAALQGWEGVIGAATDMYRGDPPVFTPVPISSHFAALQAVVSIAMALIARERDGSGQRIEVPLFDATFAAIGAHGVFVDGAPAGGRPDDFWTGLFQCADQRWVQVSAATPRFRRRLAAALQLEDWVARGLFDVDRLTGSPSLQADLWQLQGVLFASRPAQAWEDLGGDTGVPIIKCRSTAEWVATDHARTASIVRQVGAMVQPGPPIRMGDVKAGAATSRESRLPPEPGGALAGVRVLDLTQVLAGPTAGRTLAEFGADVIKVNNPHEEGAGIHFSRHRYHTDVNRGKRSILLDLKSPQGQSLLHDMVERADVLLQNFRPDAAERLRVRYEDMRSIRPDIVYVTVSAFGQPGPWTGWPGYEVQAQAAAGLRYSGVGKPAGQPFAVNDYGTGLLAAFAAALAIYQRQRTGAGQQVEAALAFTATILQSATLGSESEEAAMEELIRSQADGARRVPIDQLMRDAWVVAHGLSLTREHDTGEVVTTVGPASGLSRTPVEPGRPAPTLGTNAGDILRELGREQELDELLRMGVVAIEGRREHEQARSAAG